MRKNSRVLKSPYPPKPGRETGCFGSVTSQNISDAIEEKGFEISRRDILLDGTLKELGTYTVALKLHADVTQQITVNVVKEEEQQ